MERAGFVSLWLGDFPSEEEFDAYLEESYGDDDDGDDGPINRFASDHQIESAPRHSYDHDLQEAAFVPGRLPVIELLRGTSWSSSFIEGAGRAADEAGIAEANAFLLLFDHEHRLSDPAPESPLMFVGCFPFDKKAPPA